MEAKREFEVGQIVYSENGEQAEYVAVTGDGHIVRPIVTYEGDYDDSGPYEHTCDPTMWRSVFHEPPVAKFSAELAELHKQISEARESSRKLDEEDRQRERERAAKFKKYAVLDVLEAFLDKKITHYVEHEHYGPPKIIDVKAAVANESSYEKKLRLLSLGGELRSGEIRWELGRYSDGSGSANTVTPCASHEQAVEHVKAEIAKHFVGSGNGHGARVDWVEAAERYGVPVPDSYRRKVAEDRIRNIESNINFTRKQAESYANNVAEADRELAELRAYLAKAGA